LVIRNASAAGLDYAVLVGNVELRARPDTPAARLLKPAPTGPLPVCEPRLVVSKPYRELEEQEARILFKVGDEPYEVQSKFSTPDGAWATGSNPFFEHQRQVIEHGEWIEVRDTFRNLTDQNLPIMQQHTSPLADRATGVWLAGLQIPIKTGRHANGANPSAFAATKISGLGLVALNDEFRVHVEQLAADGSITLSDRSFVLKPGASYTAELAIVPVDSPDFWDFVNAARRMLDVNFTLDLMFAFAMKREPVYEWSDETFRRYVANKSANFIVQSNYGVRSKAGHPARATEWLAGPHDVYRDMQKRVRSLFPDGDVKTGIYFHSFLDTTEANKERFTGDRALDSAGNHITYGRDRNSYMSLYIPTLEEGRWGSEIAKVIDVILDDVGADGVFWDEFAWSTTTWVYSHWDGCSADIDWQSHQINRLKGSVCLLSREFRAHHVKRIIDRGAPLLTNGAPWTRTLAQLKFPAFAETGSISHCRKMLLYSPIALGDHLTERRPVDAYRIMLRALDHGCLYAWYSTQIFPEHKTLTEHMFPITPIEIHGGYVIGRERIVTNRSGLFGWGDSSTFESHVFDRQGRRTDEHPVHRVERDAKAYAEVRLPDGYSAAIVRVSAR
ncbi:MAG: hypothetical protein ABIK89_26645, partial [Planctomycetota bacterium]